jgi:hypothetical protein
MAGTVWDRWEQMTTGERRALLQAAVAGVPVRPAAGRRWNPDHIGDPIARSAF